MAGEKEKKIKIYFFFFFVIGFAQQKINDDRFISPILDDENDI